MILVPAGQLPEIFVVLLRALAFFLVSLVLFACWQIVSHKRYRGRAIPLTFGFCAVFLALVYRISAFIAGAWGALWFCPPAGRGAGRWIALLAGFAALYAASIFLQFFLNAVRARIGAPVLPIEWIRGRRQSARSRK